MNQVVDGSGQMFDRIAPKYDPMNRIISMGLDQSWRRKLVKAMGDLTPDDEVLDVATGTADVALRIARTHPVKRVVGLDPSVNMLDIGRHKVTQATLDERIELIEGDAQAMPFEDNRFAAACIAFGIRNVPDRIKGLKDMTRVLRPGGVLAVLELNEPRGVWYAPFARFHIHHVVPLIGAIASRGHAYHYLRDSIGAFPPPETFCEMMREAGLTSVTAEAMTMRTAYLYVGVKPGG